MQRRSNAAGLSPRAASWEVENTAVSRRSACLRVVVFVATIPLTSPLLLRAQTPLPTPAEHYDNFDPETEGRLLFSSIFSELDPVQQSLILSLMAGPGSEARTTPSRDDLIAELQLVDWTKWRPQVLDLLLHRSRVLEAVPENASEWLPTVHDSLLFFLDHLGEERLLERLLDQAAVPEDAPRGEQVLQVSRRVTDASKDRPDLCEKSGGALRPEGGATGLGERLEHDQP